MNHRSAFSRQPARLLLLDLNPPCDFDLCNKLCTSLDHFLSLASSLGGNCRVPFFGMILLTSSPEVVVPLQNVRGNFPRLHAVLREIKETFNSLSLGCEKGDVGALLSEGINEAIAMFKRQSQTLLQTTGYWTQLDISVLTSQNTPRVYKDLQNAISGLQVDCLKKIQILNISIMNGASPAESSSSSSNSQMSSSSEAACNSECGNMIDYVNVDNDVLSFESFFKSWFHDAGTDSEHLQIEIPCKAGMAIEHEPIVLKCDLEERMLSPDLLENVPHYTVCVDQVQTKSGQLPLKKSSSSQFPVYHIRVTSRLAKENICESVLYGMPHILKPTSCWKMDWDELDRNQQHFSAMCRLLYERDEVLVACSQFPDQKQSGFPYRSPRHPEGSFLLLPSNQNTMLIKALAVKELLLPNDFSSADEACDQTKARTLDALDGLPQIDSYNPLKSESKLYESLIAALDKTRTQPTKPNSRPRGLAKPRRVTPSRSDYTRGGGSRVPGIRPGSKNTCYNEEPEDLFPTHL
ncbi:hypothetical protein CAPTEDRAFT_198852 [Capitella teleta]|uniref:Meiosis 1 arrest protein n=1 Tax=Capitella teleta TaxID=283909 RepID=R7T420_CAPTE|nr:hypothetical protein CAPTEDRAFT_198852 [Capitella teleta]|eukprot:ELT87476.1 hypothetical protein CAPTEDRAFT_198852 [Capitella teleta]